LPPYLSYISTLCDITHSVTSSLIDDLTLANLNTETEKL